MSDARGSQQRTFDGFERGVTSSEMEVVRTCARSLIDFKRYMGTLYERHKTDGRLTYDAMRRYGRLARMNEEIRGLTVSLYVENTRIVSNALNAAYTTGFLGTGEMVTRAWGQSSLHGIIREDEMRRALTNDISGLAWTERMNINRETAVARIRETIVRGLHDGETYSQMAARLNAALGRTGVGALRIVRTECYRVFAEARKDRLDRVRGVNMFKEWITSKDERVRSSHAPMHGVKVPYSQDFVLPTGASGFGPGMIGVASEDINCRCFYAVDVAAETIDVSGESGIIDTDGEQMTNFNSEKSLEILSKQKPMDPEVIARVKANLEKKGIPLVQSEEMDRYLLSRGSEGVTFYGEPLIVLHTNASASGFYEELIHLGQILDGRAKENDEENKIMLEIDAKQRLIKYRRAYGLTDFEVEITTESLNDNLEKLDDLRRVGGTNV